VLHKDLDVISLAQKRLGWAAQVALAVRRVLEKLLA